MNTLVSILKFILTAGTLTMNVVTLKSQLTAIIINSIICLLICLIAFFYPIGGWCGILSHLFFLYAGGAYVSIWDKITEAKLAALALEKTENEVQHDSV